MNGEPAGIGWGIVGPGAIARTFAESLLRHHAGRIVRVTGRSPARSTAFTRECGGAAGSLDELLAAMAFGASVLPDAKGWLLYHEHAPGIEDRIAGATPAWRWMLQQDGDPAAPALQAS